MHLMLSLCVCLPMTLSSVQRPVHAAPLLTRSTPGTASSAGHVMHMTDLEVREVLSGLDSLAESVYSRARWQLQFACHDLL